MMACTPSLFVVALLCQTCVIASAQHKPTKVLLVSFDGFRWDYVEKRLPKGSYFSKLAEEGVVADYLESTFVTKSFPAHYSIATGMYDENHGIIGNHIHDSAIKTDFYHKDKSTWNNLAWWKGEPIWETVVKNKKKAMTYFWPGSEVKRPDSGWTSDMWKDYAEFGSTDYHTRVDTVMSWFTQDAVDFATLYLNEPDKTAHEYGPESEEVTKMIKTVDGYLGYLMGQIESHKLWSNLSLIVVSDHGFTSMIQEKITTLDTLEEVSDMSYETTDWGTICQITPTGATTKTELYEALKQVEKKTDGVNFTVYYKDDIPNRWHFKGSSRVQEIVIVSNEGYNVRKSRSQEYILNDHGTHGYDNALTSMRGIFYARGPRFLMGYKQGAFSLINVYSLICDLLKIQPAADIDGDLSDSCWMLMESLDYALKSNCWPWWAWLILAIGVLAVIIVIGVIICKRKQG